MTWEYENLQVTTAPSFGIWSRISEGDLDRLERPQRDGWEVFQVVDVKGSWGFTAHVLFMMRRKREG